MPKGRFSPITEEQKKFIRKNRTKMAGSEMADELGLSKCQVNNFLRREGLSVPKEVYVAARARKMEGRTSSDKKTDAYIKRNYLKQPEKTLAENIGRSHTFLKTRLRQLGLEIPKHIVEQRKLESQFKPGQTPPNKGLRQKDYMSCEAIRRTIPTRFKPGNLPHNTKLKNGVKTAHQYGGANPTQYLFIRIDIGKWQPLHRYKWEKYRGPIPKGYCVAFKNGNTLDCKMTNLELITQAENMKRNTIARFSPELRKAIHSLSKLNKKISSWEQETKSVTSQITSSPKSKGSEKKTLQVKNSKQK